MVQCCYGSLHRAVHSTVMIWISSEAFHWVMIQLVRKKFLWIVGAMYLWYISLLVVGWLLRCVALRCVVLCCVVLCCVALRCIEQWNIGSREWRRKSWCDAMWCDEGAEVWCGWSSAGCGGSWLVGWVFWWLVYGNRTATNISRCIQYVICLFVCLFVGEVGK